MNKNLLPLQASASKLIHITAVLISLALAANGLAQTTSNDTPFPKPGGAPLSAWTEIEQKGAEAPPVGFSQEKAHMAMRPTWKTYYATYAEWKAPELTALPEGKLRNLSEKPAQPRFPLKEKDWPVNPGDASICLWEDDKLAAASFSIDDNNAADVEAWRVISKHYGGLAITWMLITSNIDGVLSPGRVVSSGKWDNWQILSDEGFQLQSHSVTHVGDPVYEDGWPGPDWEAAESKQQLDSHLKGQQTKIFAYPGSGLKQFGVSGTWRDNVAKYYAAARGGGAWGINQANMIDYMEIHSTTGSIDALSNDKPNPAWMADQKLKNVLDPDPNNKVYRGWINTFTHSLGINSTNIDEIVKDPKFNAFDRLFTFLNENRKDIWIGHFADVALYGEERDTGSVKTDKSGPQEITLSLTSKMDPQVFNYPLTVKVRLYDSWKGVKAKQGDHDLPAEIIEHEGAKFALVKAVPDQGIINLIPAP